MECVMINDDSLVSIANAIRETYYMDKQLTFPDDFTSSIRDGLALNFGVLGGTIEPGIHLENTIWVNTDSEITSWTFKPTQPNTPTEGMVWFRTGTTSEVTINALKKNTILVHPIEAKQYIGGAWKTKNSYIVVNSEWVPIVPTVTYLIKDGDLIVTFTKDADWNWTDNGSYIHMYGYGEGYHEAYATNIDLTNVSQVVMTGTFAPSTAHVLGVWSPDKTPSYNNADASVQYGNTGAVLDVSSFTGLYSIGLTSTYTTKQQITNIYIV